MLINGSDKNIISKAYNVAISGAVLSERHYNKGAGTCHGFNTCKYKESVTGKTSFVDFVKTVSLQLLNLFYVINE